MGKVILLLLFLSMPVYAADYTLRFGQGIKRADKSALYSLETKNYFPNFGYYKLELGGFSGQTVRRKGSFFSYAALGVQLGKDRLYFSTSFGLAIISQPDELLGSPFQFCEEAMLGYKSIGVGIRHFSNGGLIRPNLGREYITFHYRLSL